MKRLVICIIVFLLSSGSFATTVRLESQNKISNGEVIPKTNIYIRSNMSRAITVTNFALVGEAYAEMYTGLEWSAKPWLALEASIGLEQNNSLYRGETAVWIGKGPVSLLAILEVGGSGYWYKSYAKYQLNSIIRLGVFAQRFDGVGPRVDVAIPKTPFALWSALLHDYEFHTNSVLISTRASF